MKKLLVLLTFMLIVAMVIVGCSSLNNSDGDTSTGENNNGTQAQDTPTTVKLPSFEELVALNSYENILKAHSNMYVKNTCTATDAAESYVEDAVFFQGNGKVDYHMRHTNTSSGSIVEDLSRVGNQWYYYNVNDVPYAVLELGETYILDYTLPDMFDCQPIGEAFVEGDYIAYHACVVYEGDEENSSRRRDYVFYFDKETKLIKQTTATLYSGEEVLATYIFDYAYDVKVEDLFDITLLDAFCGSPKRIDLEIVVGYNTEDQKSYSFVAITNAVLYAVIDSETYMLYTDTEFQNVATTLEAYDGTKNLTLYAKVLEFDD